MTRQALTTIAVAVTFATAAAAQAAPAAPAAPKASASGVRSDIVQQLDDAATKLIQLAEATPQDKMSWRPAEGVRSVSEVFMHVAGGNYFFPRFVGVTSESPLGRDAEKTMTDKAQVTDALKRSFDHVRGVINQMPDADLDKPTDLFGRRTTYRNALMSVVSHAHEHLGQMIAYARMNGVTPPWSVAGN